MDTNSQRGFIANLQSFRTMVPGGLQFSIEKPAVYSLHAGCMHIFLQNGAILCNFVQNA